MLLSIISYSGKNLNFLGHSSQKPNRTGLFYPPCNKRPPLPTPRKLCSNVWGSMSSFKMKLCFILVFIFLDSAGHLIASTELKNLERYCLSEQALGKSWITVDWKMDEDTLCQESERWFKVTEKNHCIFLLVVYLGDYKMRWKYRCIQNSLKVPQNYTFNQ